MKKIIAILLIFTLMFGFAACGRAEEDIPIQDTPTPAQDMPSEDPSVAEELSPSEAQKLTIGVLNGATGLSAAWLMEEAAAGNTFDDYTFEIATAPDQVVSMLMSGQIDIAALPTNVAATLYNRTDGGVQIIAVTTLGVLHILENGDSVNEIADLEGRTIHTTGEGANPEFILNHVLNQNGLTPGVDVFIEFHPNEALATLMASGEIDLAMVPEPMKSSVLMQHSDVRHAIDMTDAWQAIGDGSQLMMSAFVMRREVRNDNASSTQRFLELLEESIAQTNANPEAVGELIAQFGLLPNANIAARAIPGCNLVFVSGADIEPAIMGYFEALYQANPESIGGGLPSAAFFFVPS